MAADRPPQRAGLDTLHRPGTGPATPQERRRPSRSRASRALVLTVLTIATLTVSVVSLSVGALDVSPREVLGVLGSQVGLAAPPDVTAEVAVLRLRAPRLALGLLVGAALGIAGAGMQGVFRNPLADPSLIGVSSGAALGAVVAIVLGVQQLGRWSLPASAFAGALVAVTLVYRLSRRDGRTEIVTLLLTGIAINAVAAAGIGYLVFRADDEQLRSLTFWQLGSVADATWATVALVAGPIGLGVALLLSTAGGLNLLGLGEREAGHAGVDTRRLILLVIGVAALVTGSAVAVSGVVAFVGLAVPHLVRLISGPDHRVVLPGSALGGALLVTAADVTARTAVVPRELPLGVVTTAVGGAFFVLLLQQARRQVGRRWGR